MERVKKINLKVGGQKQKSKCGVVSTGPRQQEGTRYLEKSSEGDIHQEVEECAYSMQPASI